MRACCCSLAGTMACTRCGNGPANFYNPSSQPWPQFPGAPDLSDPAGIDYEKLATMIAEKLKVKS